MCVDGCALLSYRRERFTVTESTNSTSRRMFDFVSRISYTTQYCHPMYFINDTAFSSDDKFQEENVYNALPNYSAPSSSQKKKSIRERFSLPLSFGRLLPSTVSIVIFKQQQSLPLTIHRVRIRQCD